MPSPTRSLRVCTLAGATGIALVLTLAAPALAAPPDPVYPSAGDVARARSAVSAKAAQVDAIEARLQASHAHLASVRDKAEQAAEQFNGARVTLAARTDAARKAQDRADRASGLARSASTEVGRFAADAYMQGGTLGPLEAFFSDNGPQDVLDRASGLSIVGGIRNRSLQDASATASLAAALERQAAKAKAQEEAATIAAADARDAAQAQAQSAQQESDRIAGEQESMIRQLAALQQTSVAKERARQDGLQREAERRQALARAQQLQREQAARDAAAAAKAEQERVAQQRASEQARKAAEAAQAAAAAKAADARRQQQAAEAQQAAEEAAASRAAAARNAAEERAARDRATRAAVRAEQARQAAADQAAAEQAARDRAAAEQAAADQAAQQAAQQGPAGPAAGASTAIAFARAQLGKAYVWGADGPDAYDCSGLTSAAWRAAGVSLVHQSQLQYNETQHVLVTEAQPGDLLFFGSSTSSIIHVALYIGGGQMIEAAYAGAPIRIASIYRYNLLPYAGRP